MRASINLVLQVLWIFLTYEVLGFDVPFLSLYYFEMLFDCYAVISLIWMKEDELWWSVTDSLRTLKSFCHYEINLLTRIMVNGVLLLYLCFHSWISWPTIVSVVELMLLLLQVFLCDLFLTIIIIFFLSKINCIILMCGVMFLLIIYFYFKLLVY